MTWFMVSETFYNSVSYRKITVIQMILRPRCSNKFFPVDANDIPAHIDQFFIYCKFTSSFFFSFDTVSHCFASAGLKLTGSSDPPPSTS
jgi:hypothetical protein